MTRTTIYNTVSAICPAYWVGQHDGECKKPYAVIKYKNQNTGGNSLAGWQYFEVMVYVPKTSVSLIDDKLNSVRNALVSIGIEATNNRTSDFIDEPKKAIMRSEDFRIPKTI